MIPVLVVVGAAVGAPLRYLTDRAVQRRYGTGFPWGTVIVNVSACFLLGVVTGATASTSVIALVGTGFCGALSTYSTFSYETMRLAEQRRPFLAGANVVLSIAAGLGAAVLGTLLAHAVWG